MILGDLSSEVMRLADGDDLLTYSDGAVGQFMLYRATPRLIHIYTESSAWKASLRDGRYWAFDEFGKDVKGVHMEAARLGGYGNDFAMYAVTKRLAAEGRLAIRRTERVFLIAPHRRLTARIGNRPGNRFGPSRGYRLQWRQTGQLHILWHNCSCADISCMRSYAVHSREIGAFHFMNMTKRHTHSWIVQSAKQNPETEPNDTLTWCYARPLSDSCAFRVTSRMWRCWATS